MSLFQTQYPNNSRVVSGTPAIFKDDVVLLCDTSLGAVTINLLEIPANYWNTIYKLYVVDNSSNAAVNNITINAPTGYTINGLNSLVISTNNASALIRIINNTAYIASLTNAGGSPIEVKNQGTTITPNATSFDFVGIQALLTSPTSVKITNAFISGTYNQINALAIANDLITNQWYNIADAVYGNLNNQTNIYTPAITNNSLSSFGIGEFYDADYQGVGTYGAIISFGTQLGVWNPSLTPNIRDAVIWNNYHYLNLTGAVGTQPDTDTTNWILLPYDVENGYILKYDQITYQINNGSAVIMSRKDNQNNEVEFTLINGVYSFDVFAFGNSRVIGNKVLRGSFFNCCNINYEIIRTEGIWYNVLNNSAIVNLQPPMIIKSFTNNFFKGNNSSVIDFQGDDLFVRNNYFENCQGIIYSNDTTFDNNHILNTSFDLSLVETNFEKNQLNSCELVINKNNAYFGFNNAFKTTIRIYNSTSSELNNTFFNAILTINNSLGTFYKNTINNSKVSIITITLNSVFAQNLLENDSEINITTLNGQFGIGKQEVGNRLKSSIVTIVNFNNGNFSCNNLESTIINVNVFDGEITLCSLTGNGSIIINNMSGNDIASVTADRFSFGSPSYNLNKSYSGTRLSYGVNTIEVNLDLSDSTIYDLPTETLTIPSEYINWGGKFNLQNGSGLIISKIIGLEANYPYSFITSNGVIQFRTVATISALANQIVSTQTAPALIGITYQAASPDYVIGQATNNIYAINQVYNFN